MLPLVSCIMPTRARREWAHQALECYLWQTYSFRELIVIDDAEDASFPLGLTSVETVKYYSVETRLSIPEKRQKCCERASGSIICHFDSDDWSAPERIEDQVRRLLSSGKALTGYNAMLFACENGDVYKYTAPRTNYALGTSQCYLRSWWQRHPWNETKLIGSDSVFVDEAARAGEVINVDAGQLMVARIHDGNTAPKRVDKRDYKRVDSSFLPDRFLAVAA